MQAAELSRVKPVAESLRWKLAWINVIPEVAAGGIEVQRTELGMEKKYGLLGKQRYLEGCQTASASVEEGERND